MATQVLFTHTGVTTVNLNDQVNYFMDNEGFIPGLRNITWDDVPCYTGGVAQVNVQMDNNIPVLIPMWVQGSSVTDLNTKLGAIWALVEACSFLDPGGLQIGSESSLTIVQSTLPQDLERSSGYELKFRAEFTLTLMRKP
jgi:hypothetical protein